MTALKGYAAPRDDVRKVIPGYMKYGRDAYLPLDQKPGMTPIRWPYWFAGILALCCLAFVLVVKLWRI